MDSTRLAFNERKVEIDNYIKYLKILDDDRTTIKYHEEGSCCERKVDMQFHTTLIANAFLILYNLIESTVRNSISAIYSNIEEEGLSYDDLSEHLKKIWVKYSTTDRLKEGSFKQDTMRDCVLEFAETILRKEMVVFSKEWVEFSGNLDAKVIRNIAGKYGFDISPNGRNLVEIRKKRNRLAHGEQTFYEVGKDFTVNDIIVFKEEVFNYLSDVVEKIENYLSGKKYLKEVCS
jgi:hypothetical protein